MDAVPAMESPALDHPFVQFLAWTQSTTGFFMLATGLVLVFVTYYLFKPGRKIYCPVSVNEQSGCYFSGPEMIRYSRLNKDAKDGKFLNFLYDDAKTVYECFRRGCKISNDGNCLGWRDAVGQPYQWLTYNTSLLRAHNFGSGLVAIGCQPGQQTRVGIFAKNCPEWVLAEQAMYHFSMVLVPLYDTLGEDACIFVMDQADLTTVITDSDTKVEFLLTKGSNRLKNVISIKDYPAGALQKAKNQNIRLLKFEEVEDIGAAKSLPPQPPAPSDLATICYTSGTTGQPKGVMLTHANVLADVCGVCFQLGSSRPCSSDTMISYLPLAHMFERACQVGMLMSGGALGFFSGDIKNLADDMKALRPTLFPTVPRLLNRIHDKVWSEVSSSPIKKAILKLALSRKEAEIRRHIIRRDSIWDKLIFRKVQEGMGGRIRLVVVGSAPMDANVLSFMRCALGCVIVEGYGQTECVSPCTLTVQGDWMVDHVGPPLPCNLLKLVDVPEMEYFASAGQGEVCVKGANVFQGYFKNPQKTAETIDRDGWLHTGDIGMWLPNGTLRIVDRKKHIFKLSIGEYVAPEKIENIYSRSEYISQIFVHGESLKSSIVAIVVPDVIVVKQYAELNGMEGTFSALCSNPEVKQLIMDDMLRLGTDAGLKSFEQAKDIYLHPDPFSVQNGLLTPTLKAKRPDLRRYFKPQLDDLYTRVG